MVVRVEVRELLHVLQRLRQFVVLVVLFVEVEDQSGQIAEPGDHLAVVPLVIVALPGVVVFQHQVDHHALGLHVLEQLTPLFQPGHVKADVAGAVDFRLARRFAQPWPDVLVVAVDVVRHHVQRVDPALGQIVDGGLAFLERVVILAAAAKKILRVVTAGFQPIRSVAEFQIADGVLGRAHRFQPSPSPEAFGVGRDIRHGELAGLAVQLPVVADSSCRSTIPFRPPRTAPSTRRRPSRLGHRRRRIPARSSAGRQGCGNRRPA